MLPKGFFNSLRGRYAVVAITTVMVVLAAAALSYQELEHTRQLTTENISVRNQLLERSRLIREAVWNTRESLAAFLLNPNDASLRPKIASFLTDAKSETARLSTHPWIHLRHQEVGIRLLHATLQDLDKAMQTLIETRLDSHRQYPALSYARNSMLSDHTAFNTAAALAIEEELANKGANHNMAVYQGFVQARHLWSQMISNFRMYLANRLGSFDEPALAIQEQNIATQYQALQKVLAQLNAQDHNGQLDFQGSLSLETMQQSSTSWYSDFAEVKRIHASGEWRADATLIHKNIEPRMQAIWNLLVNLDKDIEYSANNDLSIITKVAETQTQTLWTFTALCILLISVGYFVFDRTVLRPIAGIAQALKAESQNGRETVLPKGNSQETQNLIDAFITMRDQVHARQVALEYHAMHDSLTKLGNRNRLTEHLEQAIRMANRNNNSLSLLMLDLDHFKDVNDTLGHSLGDLLLIEVGVRLSTLLRESDTIARLGGDEFAILLPTANEANARKVADKIARALGKPFRLGAQHLYISTSIGIAQYPQHGLTSQTLIQRADIAMYLAKKSKTGWALYDSNLDQHSIERLGLMSDLRDALAQNKLELYYQPKLFLNDHCAQGAEALLRWKHPEHGFISPEEIIHLAEQTGLIRDIAYWVLNEAITQAKQWQQLGLDLKIAVNLSAHNLQSDDIVQQIAGLLEVHQFDANHLTLEITENAMMSDPQRAVEILTRLDSMGIQISVDDFGTGFSSLGYLKQLPVDELKIDKSFVMDMIRDDNDAVIVRSTIDLAHNLGLSVVAEGVEDQATWDLLKTLGCDSAQGYFMSRPIPAGDFYHWLRTQTVCDLDQAAG